VQDTSEIVRRFVLLCHTLFDTERQTYVGFMLEILSPFDDLTHSLLMNKPVGCVYLTPLGAVSSTERPDILRVIIKSLEGAGYLGNWNEKEAEERRRERYIENKKEEGGGALVDICLQPT